MGRISQKCQVPTPSEIVLQMLDQVGYTDHLYGKRVLENSCGTGAFLIEIVQRYILDTRNQGFTNVQIEEGLQRDIHGFEKDRRLHKRCIENLNFVLQTHCLNLIHWDIKRKNALYSTKPSRYQFVIGNPPYLAYPELDEKTRKGLREHFESCKQGKPDYYYAFIEVSINALAEDGRLIYLVPGNFMKNLYSENLRQLILPSLQKVTDYSHYKLFDGVLTSSVILYCDRANPTTTFQYENRYYENTFTMSKINLQGKWLFENIKGERLRFSDYFHASAPVATQLNKAFVISGWENQTETYLQKGEHLIELAALRPAAGPKSLQRGILEKIIFPYRYIDEALVRYSEEEFQQRFPGAYRYLLQYNKKLLKRNSDKNALWFEYGRSQLLAHLNQPKLVVSSFTTNQPNIYAFDNDTVPYAGICIRAHPGYTITQAQRILNSEEFMEYVRAVGVCTNSTSYRISPTDINSFSFPRQLLGE